MANFIAVVDPDSERRARYRGTVEPLLPIVEGLSAGRCESGDLVVSWACGPRAPVSSSADKEGCAVIWGQAIIGSGSKTIDAAGIRGLWNDPGSRDPATFDGFHAAVVYDRAKGLKLGSDILGCFPVFYWAEGDVVLAGSSPELFRHHPSFQTKFNPAGLVGLLLLGHVLPSENLWRGVKRLPAGRLVTWRPGENVREVPHFALPISDRYFGLPFSAQLDILEQTLEEVIARHTAVGRPYGQMLSGGRDSRLLAGFLQQKGIKVTAFTAGADTDIEMRCARRVARRLRFEHRSGEISFVRYPSYADLTTRWEHMANGLLPLHVWDIASQLRQLPPDVLMAYIIDVIVGGTPIERAYSRSTHSMSFENYWTQLNRHGIQPEVLRGLLRCEVFGDLVGDVGAEIRRRYEAYPGLEFQRAWSFTLHHRQSLFIGASAWRYSFGAWPVWPALDRQLLAVTLGMPAATVAERRAEDALLCRKFPELAALPVDRNSFDTTPLQPRLRHQVLGYFRKQIRQASRRAGWKPNRDFNRLYYYRLYDFNGPGWTRVRQHAEPYRDRVLGLLHKDALDAQLPAPSAAVKFGDMIIDSTAAKNLLGFLLWSRDHL